VFQFLYEIYDIGNYIHVYSKSIVFSEISIARYLN